MLRIHASIAALLLASCGAENTTPQVPVQPAATPSPTATRPAQATRIEEESDLLKFGYSWPADAGALPQLHARLEAQLAKDRTEATGQADADRRERLESDFPYHPHELRKTWRVIGSTASLLSLIGETYTFTGGAHGMTTHEALLWDKGDDRLVEHDAILPPTLLAAINARYCAGLDREREEKRGEPVRKDPDDTFSQCPPIGEQTIAPIDEDANGRLDGLAILLDPYEAGPYAEGSYEVAVRLDAGALAAIPAEYRSAFEIRR